MAKTGKGARTGGHEVVGHSGWTAARKALLVQEKEFTQQREKLAERRRALPWEKVEKEYVFEGPEGKETLADLFDGRSQLVIYQFMFAPEWDAGCKHCSFWADHYDGMIAHLKQRDVSFVVVSRAPLAKLEEFRERMGWRFKWVSSGKTDYNYDYQASFRPEAVAKGRLYYNYEEIPMDITDREGISVFFKDDAGSVFHTYSTYARGIDMVNATYQFLDLAPRGRGENPESPQDWVRHHDAYGIGHPKTDERTGGAGEVVRAFYAAVSKKDLAAARRHLDENLEFVGLFETYPSAEAYLKALGGLLGITVRLDVKTIVSEGNQAAIFFELETKAPAAATTLVAEWHRIRDGKIVWVRSAFDGRPFEAMFTGRKPT